MPSHNLASIYFGQMELFGYSVAGEETVVAMPQLDVCFDIGKAPDQVIPIENILLTHGHMDHTAGIAYYLSHRNFCGLTPGNVLAPANLIRNIQTIIDAHGKLDGQQIPAKFIPVQPGEDHRIKPDIYARVFPVKHSLGAVGYCILEKRKKLKTEYSGLNSPQIVELKKQGIQIDNTIEVPIVTYLGDTNYVDFSQLDYIKNSRILITECTFFLEEHSQRASDGKHIHINEFAEMVEALENEHIVVTHLSQRISIPHARSILRKKLSARCFEKVILLMEHLPRLEKTNPL